MDGLRKHLTHTAHDCDELRYNGVYNALVVPLLFDSVRYLRDTRAGRAVGSNQMFVQQTALTEERRLAAKKKMLAKGF
jgi:hypothetical protein